MARLCSQAAILCEDQQQEVFIRHFLMRKGYSKLRYESDCKPGVKELFEICSKGECPMDFPDFLKIACVEYQRVKFVSNIK